MVSTHFTLAGAAATSVAMAISSGWQFVQYAMDDNLVSGYGVALGSAPPGGEINVSWTLHKKTECPGVNSRAWFGAGGFYMVEEAKPTTLPTSDEPKSYLIPTEIPESIPPGPARLEIVGKYSCRDGVDHPFRLGPVEIEVLGAQSD